jgi:hypothetical protein
MRTNTRNRNGVKNSINRYRTFDGELFVCWSAGDATADVAAAYRRGGIRTRLVAGEMFVHHTDTAKARAFARRP